MKDDLPLMDTGTRVEPRQAGQARHRLAGVVLVALLVAALAACGGSNTPESTDSLDSVEGYWFVAGDRLAIEDILLHVERRDGAYHVSVDGGPLEAAAIADGRLKLPFAGPGDRTLEFGVDDGGAAVFGYVSRGKHPEPGERIGSSWAPFAAERVAAAEYRERASAKADDRMRLALLTLELALHEWATRHDGEPPAAAEVAEAAAFGHWMTTAWSAAAVPWPVNPYTGAVMQAGSEPGDFTYTRDGGDFTLIGRLHDGSTFTAGDESAT